MAMVYLAVLYSFKPSKRKTNSYNLVSSLEQTTFVQQCIIELNKEYTNNCDLKRKIRTLNLVKLFVQYALCPHSPYSFMVTSNLSHGKSSETINALQIEDVIGVSLPFNVAIQVVDGPRFMLICPLGKNTKVTYLRDYIVRSFPSNSPKQDFRLMYSACELKDDSATLERYQISANSVVFCLPRLSTKHVKREFVHVVEGSSENNNDSIKSMSVKKKQRTLDHTNTRINCEIMPGISELLSNRCMETLFSLLSNNFQQEDLMHAYQLRSLVWDLLQLLPTDPSLLHGINAMGFTVVDTYGEEKHDWDQWLPLRPSNETKSWLLFRLLYSLQVVEYLIIHLETTGMNHSQSMVVEDGALVDDVEKDDEIIVVNKKESGKLENRNRETVVVIDDDEDDESSSLKQTNDNTVENMSSKQPYDEKKATLKSDSKHWCTTFILHGGIDHLIDLFLSLDLSNLELKSIQNTKRDHEINSLVIACANKLIFLIITLTKSCREDQQDISFASKKYFLFFLHLLKIIHWAVTFQSISTTNESNESKYITGGWSSTEIGGALAIHCLSMVKIMTTRASLRHNYIQGDNPSSSNILGNAISSSIVMSPSSIVRSSALPIFKHLLFLYGREDRNSCESLDYNNLAKFHSPSLSVLIPLLPVVRNWSSATQNKTDEEASRCTVLFELIISYIDNMWSSLTSDLKEKVIIMFKEQLLDSTKADFSNVQLSNPPTIRGIHDLGDLFIWTVKEIKGLRIREYESAKLSPYVEGLLSLIQSVALQFGSPEINQLIANIMPTEQQSFLQLLFENGTFRVTDVDGRITPIVSTPNMRKKVLDLLIILCKGCERNLDLLFALMKNVLYSNSPREDLTKEWIIDPMVKQKSGTGLVGMKNQGATCYLNSLLQQFFHTPSLRQGLLSSHLDGVNEMSYDKVSEGHRLLFQLQRLFGNLLLSEKRDFDTIDLVKSIRGYDGNPIRPGEQQDVDEFFNLFCDRLETALKTFPQSRLLHNVFGGQLSHLITCQECHYSSERIEDFLSISLDVKGKHDIFESLQSYICGEVLDGSNKYLCSKCDTKRDSIKRCCIKTLPNVLICHLKRFEFDLETLRKVKVNDRFEFPTEIDMKKYTKEGIANKDHSELSWRGDNYYKYTLRGVLVHTGTADSGHYYSLSHVRDSSSKTTSRDSEDGSWFCFNDSSVSPFDLSTLEIATFGGIRPDHEHDHTSHLHSRFESTKSYSAYLLIYDRCEHYEFDSQMNGSPRKMQLSSLDKQNKSSCPINPWADSIVRENLRHAMDIVIFSPEYNNFIIQVCTASSQNKDQQSTNEAMQILTFQLIENLVHARHQTSDIKNMFSVLCSWYQSSTDGCRWFLHIISTTHRHWIEKILLHCYKVEVRVSFVHLLEVIFRKMCPLERDSYGILDSDTDNSAQKQCDDGFDSDGDVTVYSVGSGEILKPHSTLGRVQFWKSKSVVAVFVGSLLDLLDDCANHWRHFDQLFDCLDKFASCGQDEAIFLIRCGTILRLVELYQGEKGSIPPGVIVRSPKAKKQYLQKTKNNMRVKTGDRNKRPNFLPLLSLLSKLIRSGSFPDESESEVSDSDSSVSETENYSRNKACTFGQNSSYLTSVALKRRSSGVSYELPRREGYFVTRTELLDTMLNEVMPQGDNRSDKNGSYCSDLSTTVSEIICHICYNDFAKTLSICSQAQRIIKDHKAYESSIAIQVFRSSLHIRDKHLEPRIKCVTSAIFCGLEANAEYDNELSLILEALYAELVRRTPGARGREEEVYFHSTIVENMDRIVSLLGQKTTDRIKHTILSIVKSLLPEEIKAPTTGLSAQDEMPYYLDEESVKDRVFLALKDLHRNVVDAIESQCSQSKNDYFASQGNMTNHSYAFESTYFRDYFSALRICLTGPKTDDRLKSDEHWIYDITETILPGFWEVDNCGRNQNRPVADPLKGEIIKLFEHLVELDPNQFIEAVLNDSVYSSSQTTSKNTQSASDPVTKMMEVFITSSNNFDYNNNYMSHFYRLITLLADHNEHFKSSVLTHENWKWALKSFVLNQNIAKAGPPLYDTILFNTVKYLQIDENFREAIFRIIVSADGKESFLDQSNPDIASLKLLSSIFKCEILKNKCPKKQPICSLSFVSGECGGMSRLSSVMKKILSQIPLESDTTSTPHILENLLLSLNCMHLVLQALNINDVKKVIDESWPEIDEMNSFFTQLLTRTEDEWKIYHREDRSVTLINDIVAEATNLQKIIVLSAEAKAANSNTRTQ